MFHHNYPSALAVGHSIANQFEFERKGDLFALHNKL